MIDYNEKVLLIFLVSTTILSILVILFLSIDNNTSNDTAYSNKIKVIHTGGTISDSFYDKYDKDKSMFGDFDITSLTPLITSSNVVPSDWNKIAMNIKTNYNNYDSFVIVHGRDTLPYTASAISFILENLSKPVIFCDGDLIRALKFASVNKIPEVMVLSRDKLLRGVQTVSTSTSGFSSPNYPPLYLRNSLAKPTDNLVTKYVNPRVKIVIVKLFPGIDSRFLDSIWTTENPVDGVVFETYATGSYPATPEFLKSIHDLSKNGVVMVNVSQYSKTDILVHIDDRLVDAGVVNGGNMTTSTAFAKLHYLIGNVSDKYLIGRLIQHDLRGELATPTIT
jgi:L-asparaginase